LARCSSNGRHDGRRASWSLATDSWNASDTESRTGVAAGSQAACYGHTAKQQQQQRQRQAIHDVPPFSEDLVRAFVGGGGKATRNSRSARSQRAAIPSQSSPAAAAVFVVRKVETGEPGVESVVEIRQTESISNLNGQALNERTAFEYL